MRTIKLLLVLAPFALAAACGGKKPEMAEPAVPTTPDMSLDSGLPSMDASSATSMMDSAAPTTDTVDAAVAMPAPVDAGAPMDAGKGGKDAGAKKGTGPGTGKKK